MAIPDQNAFLANAGNADVAAYVNNGGNFNDWWNNYGVNENRQWEIPANQAVGAAPQPAPAPTQQSLIDQSGLNLDGVDWGNYRTVNQDLAGMTDQQARQHFIDYGQFENNRSLGYQTAANQGQFYNLRDGTELGPTNAGEMNAFANNNFTNHTGFDANTFAGTGGGVTDPTVMNPDAVNFVQGGGSMENYTPQNMNGGLGGLGGFNANDFMAGLKDMFSDFGQQQQSQWDNMYGNLNQWGQTAYNGAGAANNGFQAGQPTNQSPIYNPNSGGTTPRNGFGGPLGNNNPWSPTF